MILMWDVLIDTLHSITTTYTCPGALDQVEIISSIPDKTGVFMAKLTGRFKAFLGVWLEYFEKLEFYGTVRF